VAHGERPWVKRESENSVNTLGQRRLRERMMFLTFGEDE
jgi:hypothetical protein